MKFWVVVLIQPNMHFHSSMNLHGDSSLLGNCLDIFRGVQNHARGPVVSALYRCPQEEVRAKRKQEVLTIWTSSTSSWTRFVGVVVAVVTVDDVGDDVKVMFVSFCCKKCWW